MRETHAGHQITEAEFYGMVDSLRTVLRQRGTGITETNELLRLLAPMKRDIVEGPARRSAP
jgi:hemoglobin